MGRKKNGEVAEETPPPEQENIPPERALVFQQLDEQYNLPWDMQRALIASQDPLTEVGVRTALAVVRSFGLPLQGINVLSTKQGPRVYVNADGIRWRLLTDKRGIKSNTPEVLHNPTKDEPWVLVKTVIVLGDGSEYAAFGAVACAPSGDVSAAILKAETKSARRAGIKCVGVALPIFEDYIEWRHEQGVTIEGEARVISEQPTTAAQPQEPHNLAQFLVWLEKAGYTIEQAVFALGVEDESAIAMDAFGSYTKLKEKWDVRG